MPRQYTFTRLNRLVWPRIYDPLSAPGGPHSASFTFYYARRAAAYTAREELLARRESGARELLRVLDRLRVLDSARLRARSLAESRQISLCIVKS